MLKISFWRSSQASNREDAYKSGAVRTIQVSGYLSAVDVLDSIKNVADAFEHQGYDDLRFDLKHERWQGKPFRCEHCGHDTDLNDLSFMKVVRVIEETRDAW